MPNTISYFDKSKVAKKVLSWLMFPGSFLWKWFFSWRNKSERGCKAKRWLLNGYESGISGRFAILIKAPPLWPKAAGDWSLLPQDCFILTFHKSPNFSTGKYSEIWPTCFSVWNAHKYLWGFNFFWEWFKLCIISGSPGLLADLTIGTEVHHLQDHIKLFA